MPNPVLERACQRLWLQPTLLAGWVSDCGSLEICAVADSTCYASIHLPHYLFTTLKKSMIALLLPGHLECVPVPSQ
jgi:hypothetical protein